MPSAAPPHARRGCIDFSWGDDKHPRVTLVGKGVCFDTGGLDIKPDSGMLNMKKDMGGAATALALAHMIMARGLKVRLRVLIPAVENAIAGDSFRPRDIYTSRKGITVEIGNTDAEGRLVLADALSLADDDKPELIADFATLTGAARAHQCLIQLALDHRLDEAAHPITHPSFDRIEPIVEKIHSCFANRLRGIRLRDNVLHGVVSYPTLQRQIIRGF